jgi:hypothetical protein
LVELFLRQNRRPGGRLIVQATLEGNPVEAGVIFAVYNGKVEAGAVEVVMGYKTDACEAEAGDLIKAHTDPNAGAGPAIVGIPVAHQHAVQRQ